MTTLAETMPGTYWVKTTNHPIIENGTRYLVMRGARWPGWLICWKDGKKPVGLGALLKPEHFEREEE